MAHTEAWQAGIDRSLREAAEARLVPGVVAVAATAEDIIYEGAFGRLSLPDGAPMRANSVVWIASMTKAITAVAAMQLVEQGKLALDRPAAELAPELDAAMVLEGFDAAGRPKLRPARGRITLRHLLTHTSGFSYENWNPLLLRYVSATGLPSASGGRLAGLAAPLIADPGTRWEYGIGLDWVGRLVEIASGERFDAYLQKHIFSPVGMTDTSYLLRGDQEVRLAKVHRRAADGTLHPFERERLHDPEFFPGGGGLHGTAADYVRFLRMLLQGGRLDDAVLLRPETVALMGLNQTGALEVGTLRSANSEMSNHFYPSPGIAKGWGLSFLINTEDAPTGRSAGSMGWAGMGNCYYWLDPKRGVAGVMLTQILPFADPLVLRLFEAFEAAVYVGIECASA
jgi:CubicO group peptidase (beta-lactamase class C family)